MKKIGMILLIILIMLFVPNVYASEGIAIESVDVDSKSGNVVIVNPATFDGLSLKFDVRFDDINDFIKYKLVIKNSTNTDYELTESTSSSSYITYEYNYEDGSKVLTANTTKTMFITIKYNNSVPIDKFNGGNYLETKSFTINLDDGTDEIIVPGTSDSLYCYLILLIGTLVFSIALLKATKNKKFLVLIIASMVLIPIDIHAIVKLKLTVESRIEINNPDQITEIIYWALQENGTADAYDHVSSNKITVSTYRLVISNKEQEGVYKGSFDGNTEFTIDQNTGTINVPWITENNLSSYATEVKIDGKVVPASTAFWFISLGEEVEVDNVNFDLSTLNTINVTNMMGMFADVGIISSNITLDLRTLNTSNVTNMTGMFSGIGHFTDSLNIDLSGWDISKVTNMSYMFSGAGINAYSLNLNLSGWDISKVTDMSYMFSNMATDSELVTLDLHGWSLPNNINFSELFNDMASYSFTVSIDLSDCDTTRLTNTSHLFDQVGYNISYFTLDLSGWDLSNVENMEFMFNQVAMYSTSFTLYMKNWIFPNTDDLDTIFAGMAFRASIIDLDMSDCDTSRVTNMSGLFYSSYGYANSFKLNLSGWNTSNVTNMTDMFGNTAIDASERIIILPATNGNGLANTETIIYGINESIYADINKRFYQQ